MREYESIARGLMNQSRPGYPAWNIEQRLESQTPKWNYIDGCMLKALLDLFAATQEQDYCDFVKDYLDYFISASGEIKTYKLEDYNCDNINSGKALLSLYAYTKDEKYKTAATSLYKQLQSQPRTESGNFWHKQIYPQQIWLDGLYMVQAFYMQYEKMFEGNRNYKDIVGQFRHVQRYLREPETGLLFHGYDESRTSLWCDRTTGCSPNFWSRSLGWYAMALVDTVEHLDEQLFAEYMELQGYLLRLCEDLLLFRDNATGLFWQVTNQAEREGNYIETSASAALAYAFVKGARLGYLPHVYLEIGWEMYQSLIKYKLIKKADGRLSLKDICLVAGLGGMPGKGSYKDRDGSYAYYISEPVVEDDAKGIAPFLFLAAELIREGKL